VLAANPNTGGPKTLLGVERKLREASTTSNQTNQTTSCFLFDVVAKFMAKLLLSVDNTSCCNFATEEASSSTFDTSSLYSAVVKVRKIGQRYREPSITELQLTISSVKDHHERISQGKKQL